MTRRVLLVTGLPASGKTTLARSLAAELGLPLLSLDTIKETLFSILGVRDRAWSLQLRAASAEIMWALLPDCPTGVVIDIWIDPTRDGDIVREGLRKAGVDTAYEILCDVPAEVAVERYATRDRHPGHLPPDEATLNRIREAADVMRPLDLGPTLRVDTTGDVDLDDVLVWLHDVAGSVP